ncbi:MAG: CBS domain-containing protein, partial [Candidatus Nitrosocaldaceae archaeon]
LYEHLEERAEQLNKELKEANINLSIEKLRIESIIQSMEDAVNMMLDRKIKRLPVVSEGKLVGMVTASDIMVVEPKLIASIASIISLNSPYAGG